MEVRLEKPPRMLHACGNIYLYIYIYICIYLLTMYYTSEFTVLLALADWLARRWLYDYINLRTSCDAWRSKNQQSGSHLIYQSLDQLSLWLSLCVDEWSLYTSRHICMWVHIYMSAWKWSITFGQGADLFLPHNLGAGIWNLNKRDGRTKITSKRDLRSVFVVLIHTLPQISYDYNYDLLIYVASVN